MPKIMLVEDDKSLREIYSIRLVAEGYNIVSAGDGEEGLAMAVKEKPDLIIADVMMPKISGFDMLDILRSEPETANIKVIMMTALSSEDQRQRGENLGADRYLVKSQVGIEDVINTVHDVLGDRANSNAQANLGIANTVAQIGSTSPAPEANSAPAQAPAATPAPAAAPAPAPAQAPAPAPAPAPVQFTAEQLQGYVNEGRITAEQAQAILQQQALNAQQNTNQANFNQAPVATPAAALEAQPVQAQQAAGAQFISQPAASYQLPLPPSANGTAIAMPGTAQLPMPPTYMQAPVAAPTPVAAPQFMQAAPTVPTQTPTISTMGAGGYLESQQIVGNVNPEEVQRAATTNSALRGVERIDPNPELSQQIRMEQEMADRALAGGGERVIQPIHDPHMDENRAAMEEKMAALLGDVSDERTAINGRKLKVPKAAPAPAPAPAPAEQPVQEEPAPTEVPTSSDTDISSMNNEEKAAILARVLAKSEAAEQKNANPDESGDLEMDDYHGLEMKIPKASEPNLDQASSEAEAAAIEAVAESEAAEVADARAEIEAENAAIEAARAAAAEAEAAPEPVEPIRPGYVNDLAEQINEDDGTPDDDDDSMSARMARELVDDEITLAAKEMREKPTPKPPVYDEEGNEIPQGFLDDDELENALPDFLKEDNEDLGPNIGGDDAEPQAEESQA